MYVADLRRLFASFCGKLIFSAASMDRLPSTLAINCPQHAHTVLCPCGTYLHMRTDPEALGFSSNFKWKSTINKQLNNKTEVIGILPVGKQVQMTRVVSSDKTAKQKGLAFSPLPSVGGWSDFTLSDQSLQFSSICANLSFNSKKQFTPFLK